MQPFLLAHSHFQGQDKQPAGHTWYAVSANPTRRKFLAAPRISSDVIAMDGPALFWNPSRDKSSFSGVIYTHTQSLKWWPRLSVYDRAWDVKPFSDFHKIRCRRIYKEVSSQLEFHVSGLSDGYPLLMGLNKFPSILSIFVGWLLWKPV